MVLSLYNRQKSKRNAKQESDFKKFVVESSIFIIDFYVLGDMSSRRVSPEIQTKCVKFSPTGKLHFNLKIVL